MGPIMTRLAGELGDGWISHELISPSYLEQRILPDLLAGIERGGRNRGDVDVVVSAPAARSTPTGLARVAAARTDPYGFYAYVRTYAEFFDFHGVAAEQQAVIEAFRGGTGADFLGDVVPDKMVDAVTLAGTPDEVRERLLGYDGLADTIKLTPPTHGLAAADTRLAQAQIIEMIASLRGA